MLGHRKRNYYIVLLITIVFLTNCSKEDKVDMKERHSASFHTSDITNSLIKLPVNLSKYNVNAKVKTKSGVAPDTSFAICIDSIVDYTKIRQVYFEESKWIYCQYPLKSNETGIYAAVGAEHKHISDSLVKTKSFFLQVGNSNPGRLSEYIVTMIPTKKHSESFPDFDYLDKPSFSGVILYSDKAGVLLRTEYLQNGIIKRCALKENTTALTQGLKTKSFHYCSKCGTATHEADGICIVCKPLNLNSIVITGDGDNIDWWNYIRVILQDALDNEDYTEDGGGGNDNKQYGGRKIEDADTKVLITCNAGGCYNAPLTSYPVTKGSDFSYTAPMRSENKSCWFKQWKGDFSLQKASVNGRLIQISSVTSPQTFTAEYVSNTDCSKIAELLQDERIGKVLYALLSALKKHPKSFIGETEYASVWYNTKKTEPKIIRGTKGNVQLPIKRINGQTPPHQVVQFSHYHPTGILRPSIRDYVVLCMLFLHNAANLNTSTWSVVTKTDVMLIRMGDPEKFKTFINKLLIDKKTKDWYNQQSEAIFKYFEALFKKNDIYAGCKSTTQNVNAVKSFIKEFGLELYWGTLDNSSNPQKLIWNNTDFIELDQIPLGCFNQLVETDYDEAVIDFLFYN